ncbi:GTP cyclohydrolase [mine drainage metagenome]|uniref:GTP cyclohydrolase n=1 Tax=mine drainage metagenome TaxID=410659 RepID=T0ZWW8_9ZZZZ
MPPPSRTLAPARTIQPDLTDVQLAPDTRGLAIDQVGIKRLLLPVRVPERSGQLQSSLGTFSLAVALDAQTKGIHMSRLVEIAMALAPELTLARLLDALVTMCERVGSTRSMLEVSFPFFRRKQSPVSGAESPLDYTVTWSGERSSGCVQWTWTLGIPVTTLCPCSREISLYGAHNQRAQVTLVLAPKVPFDIETGLDLVESQASAELYALLKRSDEKWVTERAFERPRFVEDLVRDIARSLASDPRLARFSVEVENLESIHHHSAFARLSHAGAGPADLDPSEVA